ncbi:MAG: 6-carboxytetrahydropterin synthase QueD [Gemmatimonadota bacterium]|nr:6-carboxytetrahydropterin synthase QueD [Gemmatimonadota bacterium]
MYRLSVEGGFSSAHYLRDYQGKCSRLHGHNWRVRLTVRAGELDPQGMSVDFTELKAMLNSVLEKFDHVDLNQVSPFDKQNPTAENIARVIFEMAGEKLPAGVEADKVELWESEKNKVEYSNPDYS